MGSNLNFFAIFALYLWVFHFRCYIYGSLFQDFWYFYGSVFKNIMAMLYLWVENFEFCYIYGSAFWQFSIFMGRVSERQPSTPVSFRTKCPPRDRWCLNRSIHHFQHDLWGVQLYSGLPLRKFC